MEVKSFRHVTPYAHYRVLYLAVDSQSCTLTDNTLGGKHWWAVYLGGMRPVVRVQLFNGRAGTVLKPVGGGREEVGFRTRRRGRSEHEGAQQASGTFFVA